MGNSIVLNREFITKCSFQLSITSGYKRGIDGVSTFEYKLVHMPILSFTNHE